MNLKFAQLEAFVWVADLGSFRRAAERLNTTQPNISSRISSLEQMLDVTLMERDAGSVRLTSKGVELLDHARRVLRSGESFLEASGRAALYEGVLKLGVTELVMHTWLRDFMKALKREYPNVLVELTVDLSARLKHELFSRSIDLAFQSGPFERKTSGAEPLGTYRWIWVASPDLPGLDERELSIEQLTRYPILTHARDTRPHEEVAGHFRLLRASTARIVPSSNLAACLHMSLDSLGIATVPAGMAREMIDSGRLRQIDYAWTPDPLVFLARYDAARSPGFVARAARLASRMAHDHVRQFGELWDEREARPS